MIGFFSLPSSLCALKQLIGLCTTWDEGGGEGRGTGGGRERNRMRRK